MFDDEMYGPRFRADPDAPSNRQMIESSPDVDLVNQTAEAALGRIAASLKTTDPNYLERWADVDILRAFVRDYRDYRKLRERFADMLDQATLKD